MVEKLRISIETAGYGKKTIIRSFFYELPLPGFLAIIGSNGTGKSTLLKVLSGQLSFEGKIEASSSNPNQKNPFYFLEQKNTLAFEISVFQLVLMGRFSQKKWFGYSAEDEAMVMEKLAYFNLESRKDVAVHELSGGEQQMVWLAQALVSDKPIILLDEPTQFLDYKTRIRLMDTLETLVSEAQKTIVLVTHDLDLLNNRKLQILDFDSFTSFKKEQ